MKNECRGVLVFISILTLLVSFIVPGGPAMPLVVSADPGIMKWDTVSTPNSIPEKNDILNPYFNNVATGSEVRDLAVGNDGMTLMAAVTVDGRYLGLGAGPVGVLLVSKNRGISWSTSADRALRSGGLGGQHVFNVLIAPDDPKFWAVTAGSIAQGPIQLWISNDAGATWNNTNAPLPGGGEAISAMDISVDVGNGRDLAFVTRSGAGSGRLFTMGSKSFGTWALQGNPIPGLMDYFAVKFSPTYAGDNSIVLIYGDTTSTYYNIGLRDINSNTTNSWVFAGSGVEIKAASSTAGSSPAYTTLASACLQLPSDFSGQSASLRKAFVSLNVPVPGANDVSGVFRIDDSVPAVLLVTTSAFSQINSIAFFGTISTGKLMAGLVYGIPCRAVVGTLFADTPCTCAGSCLYPPLKPATGAGNQSLCSDSMIGIGSALVGWSSNGSLAYAATGSGKITAGSNWWNSGLNSWITTLVPDDESAMSISRNNGETWNQLSLIDTTIDWFNDVAVSADCTTVYLASVHRNNGVGCDEFDSVWRATINPAVTAPLPAIAPLGTYWERVLTQATSVNCKIPQTDLPILRTLTSCTEQADGGVVAWGARFAPSSTSGSGLMAWSPDYGDYWQPITPRHLVGDFTFDSARVIYNLSPLGMVQKLVYTGTSWTTSLPSSDTSLGLAHTIAAKNGRVLAGAALINDWIQYTVAYSADSGGHWIVERDPIPTRGRVHVLFDVDFTNNSMFYAAVDNATGTIYRNAAPAFTRWDSNNMMDVGNSAWGPDWWSDGYSQSNGDPPHQFGYYGIVQAFTGNPQPALYGAHDNVSTSIAPYPGGLPSNSGVCRTLEPRNGMPKPGIYWDCLDIFSPVTTDNVSFTLEPSSLKACGCCTLNTSTTLWAIDNESGLRSLNLEDLLTDNITSIIDYLSAIKTGKFESTPGYFPALNQGMLWAYTDCLAKKGPLLRGPADTALVGADPVTGRNQQVDLAWEQLCLSTCYEIQVAKDSGFTLAVVPWSAGFEDGAAGVPDAKHGYFTACMNETSMTKPAAWIAPGRLPEAGSAYYWRVRSYRSATQQIAVSPWSEARSFRVKPGFIVNTPYYGVQLLAPDNGCQGCRIKPASFSWSPWKETTRYEFVLSKDAQFTQIIQQAATSTTGYEYAGTLDYGTSYFWRVRAVEVNGQPIPSDWSATFNFRTESQPEAPPPAAGEAATPLWVWIVIATGVVLIVLTLIFIIRSRQQI